MHDDDDLMFEVTVAKAPPGEVAVKRRISIRTGASPRVTLRT